MDYIWAWTLYGSVDINRNTKMRLSFKLSEANESTESFYYTVVTLMQYALPVISGFETWPFFLDRN